MQRAEPAAGILVADVAFGRHRNDLMAGAFRIDIFNVFGLEQLRRDLRAGPNVVQLQPVIDRRVHLLGGVGRQHALLDAGVGIILAGAEAVDGVVDDRLDAGFDQGRDHPHVKGRLRRKEGARCLDAEGVADDVAMPSDLLDDVSMRDQRHQRVEEAEGAEAARGRGRGSYPWRCRGAHCSSRRSGRRRGRPWRSGRAVRLASRSSSSTARRAAGPRLHTWLTAAGMKSV